MVPASHLSLPQCSRIWPYPCFAVESNVSKRWFSLRTRGRKFFSAMYIDVVHTLTLCVTVPLLCVTTNVAWSKQVSSMVKKCNFLPDGSGYYAMISKTRLVQCLETGGSEVKCNSLMWRFQQLTQPYIQLQHRHQQGSSQYLEGHLTDWVTV
jgi:hypothetical protein